MISNVVTILTVLAICCALVGAAVVVVFAPATGAGVDVAGLVVCGALEPPELVWLVAGASAVLPVDVVSGVETGCATDVGEAVTVLVVATAGEDATLAGLSGLTGLVGLVGFVTLLTQVFDVVVQFPDQIGEP